MKAEYVDPVRYVQITMTEEEAKSFLWFRHFIGENRLREAMQSYNNKSAPSPSTILIHFDKLINVLHQIGLSK